MFFSANLRADRPKKSKYTDVCNTILSSTNFDDTFGYHSACYSNFTAVPRSRCSQSYPDHIVKPDDAHKLQKPLLRSNIPSSISSSNSGVLKAVCVFCNQHTKRHNNGQHESLGSCEAFVQGPHQQRPSNFQNELNNSVFKTSFLRFLASEWTEPRCAIIIKDRQIYLALDTDCYMYRCDPDQSDKVTREKVADLTCEM